MAIVVTGATGHLGRLVVESLLKRGVPAENVVATGRRVETIADLAERGVDVRRAEFDRPDTLATAFAGAAVVLLVSGSEFGTRVAGHRAVVEAARAAGAGRIVYTSAPHADTSTMLLARDHRATEEIVTASGLPWTVLRNGFYHEVYTDQLPSYLQQGAIVGAAGTGRISGAARADLADAAAAVLTGDGHAERTYELGGDEAFTMPEFAAELSRQSGRTIPYRTVPVAEYQAALEGFGLPSPVAEVYADIDRGIEAGLVHIETGDLRALIGRPTTPLSQSIADALAHLSRSS